MSADSSNAPFRRSSCTAPTSIACTRKLPKDDFARYRKRKVVERTIGFLKQSRSVLTLRQTLRMLLDKLKLAFIKIL